MLINRLDFSYFFCFFSLLFFSNTRLLFFAPFLILSYYKRPLLSCLWISLFSGLTVDLFASYHRFGLTSFNYCLCGLILYHQRQHFFADRMSTLPLMTFLFSILSTFIHFFSHLFVETSLSFSLYWAVSDLILMPLLDAAYAFVLFVLPPFLAGYRPKKAQDYFL